LTEKDGKDLMETGIRTGWIQNHHEWVKSGTPR
jgi:hypothetical protein